jgi:lysophospholipase L1-like esterase
MRKAMKYVLIFFVFLNWQETMSQMRKKEIKFLPLGDSYTICEGAKWEESWPFLLTKHLNDAGIPVKLLGNPSVTGYTTDQLISEELPVFDKLKPDFVTVLIGVNDYVQGRTEQQFSDKLTFVLDHVQKQLPDQKKIILITIPDYSVTPAGAQYAHGRDVHQGITRYNEIIKTEASKRKLPVVDIFPSTLKMKIDPSLICEDGLHPSAEEYANWEVLIRAAYLKHWR